MSSLGLKLWSRNESYARLAPELYERGCFDYIELYALPFTYDDTIGYWQNLKIPFIIHAPHFMHGVNLSIKEKYLENLKLIEDGLKFADKLKAEILIVHPGISGDYKGTARQLKLINDSRIALENKPYKVESEGSAVLTIHDRAVGAAVGEIEYILSVAGVSFCLDIGHSICAANSFGVDPYEQLRVFNNLSPKLYHLSDGDINAEFDTHEHIGHGSFDFEEILKIIGTDKKITIETKKDSKVYLNDFVSDSSKLKSLMCAECTAL